MEPTRYASAQPIQNNVPTANTGVFDTYTDFVTYMRGRRCPNCTTPFIQSPNDVFTLFKNWLNGAAISSHIQCKQCSKTTCIACFNKGASTTEKPANNGQNKVSWCCSRGRLFTIYIMLCGFDEKYCSTRLSEASTSRQTQQTQSSSRNGSRAGNGTGYTAHQDMGMSGLFGRGRFAPVEKPHDVKKAAAETLERRTDRFDQIVFAFLAVLCPSPGNDQDDSTPLSRFDVDPPKAVASMLANSKILDKAAELLRNDSLDNATQRKHVYMALIGFLKRVGVHPVSKQEAMYNERVVFPDTVNLLTLSFGGGAAGNGSTASSLAACLRKLNIQSDLMMRNAQRLRKEFNDKRGEDMLWLCREISDLSAYLRIEEWWTQLHGNATQMPDHGIVEIPDKEIWTTHMLASPARQLVQSPSGRIRRLITEITSLKTGLSSGIYVKHAMSRPDLMKALIVGPAGTPYENGLFEFDIFCPRDYPQVPPLVAFRYPSGCFQGLNPNLHQDGKVCLSLLGTWVAGVKGEEWQAGISTLLQVLISIQAMIFCDDPMQNEPGFADSYGGRGNIGGPSDYTKNIRSLTIKYGVLFWTQNTSSLWKDIVENHLRKAGNTILQTAERWARESCQPSKRGYDSSSMLMLGSGGRVTDIVPLLSSLQTSLRKYGANYVVDCRGVSGNQQPAQGRSGNGSRNPPYSGGSRFDGSGGMSGYGTPGSRFGRGF